MASAIFFVIYFATLSVTNASPITFTIGDGQTKCFKDDFVKGQVSPDIIKLG